MNNPFRKKPTEENDLECKTLEVPIEHRGTRRFIPYCDGVAYGGVITKNADKCKAKDCWSYRELDIPKEPEGWDE